MQLFRTTRHRFRASLKCLLVYSILHIGVVNSVFAESYLPFLKIDTLTVYKHWNTERKEITGYTRIKYQKIKEGSVETILETQENTEKDGKVFSQRKVWFDAKTGEIVRYFEEDLRADTKIENTYDEKSITTLLQKKGDKTDLKESRSSKLIPWELLWFYLQKQVKEHGYDKEKKMTIYFPHALFETSAFGTKLDVIVKREKKVNVDTPSGKQAAIRILAKPTNFLLSLVPQLNFRFTISTEEPNDVLRFEQGETQYILESFEKIQQ